VTSAQSIPVRRSKGVRRVVAEWRRLTGGRPVRDADRRTLLACSGGADSSALALGLGAAAGERLVLAHVVHDLRPRGESLADRDRAGELAESLGLPFVEAEVRVGPGNAEAGARRARYAALARLARERACPFVATAHHADDQLETLLMRLVRGAGLCGLGGVRTTRPLDGGVTLVRPMLRVTRADCERICEDAGWAWAEDTTNTDVSRLRSSIRYGVLPGLGELRGRAARRAADTAELLADAAGLIRDCAETLLADARRDGDALNWPREALSEQRPVVLGELIRLASGELNAGEGTDRLPSRVASRVAGAIRDASTEPRRFVLHRMIVTITAHHVRVEWGS